MKRHSILHLAQVVPALLTLFLLLVSSLYAQKKGSSNTSITLGMSFNNLNFYVAPPVGVIGELGLKEWATIGVYGGFTQIKNNFNNAWTAGARFTFQPRGFAEIIFRKPINTYGIKPYIGIAGGWLGVHSRYWDRTSSSFTYSAVYGVRYYPIDRWGLMVEWGEGFNGATGLNVGISYGGRK